MARLRLEEEQAILRGLEAQLEELETGERPEEVERLTALVGEYEAIARKWEYERNRMTDLSSRGQGSDKERFDTDMEHLAAGQKPSQARAQLQLARNGARAEVRARARQQVAARQAIVQRAARDLEKTEIRAPFAGAVTTKRTEVGEWIAAGGPVCDMVAVDVVKVRVDVPEAAVPFLPAGAAATIEFEALGTRTSAPVSRVIPQASPAARTFPVELDLPNRDHTLLPGMFVWAYVPSGPPGKRLLASRDAIVAQGLAKQVFVLRPGPEGAYMAMPLAVTTGLEVEGGIEISAPGLQAGDLVVTRANERLYGPTPVILRPAESAGGEAPPPGTRGGAGEQAADETRGAPAAAEAGGARAEESRR